MLNFENDSTVPENTIKTTPKKIKRKLFTYSSKKKKLFRKGSYIKNLCQTDLNSSFSQGNIRKIPKALYKVLDAPKLQDDFYLNILD